MSAYMLLNMYKSKAYLWQCLSKARVIAVWSQAQSFLTQNMILIL